MKREFIHALNNDNPDDTVMMEKLSFTCPYCAKHVEHIKELDYFYLKEELEKNYHKKISCLRKEIAFLKDTINHFKRLGY